MQYSKVLHSSSFTTFDKHLYRVALRQPKGSQIKLQILMSVREKTALPRELNPDPSEREGSGGREGGRG